MLVIFPFVDGADGFEPTMDTKRNLSILNEIGMKLDD